MAKRTYTRKFTSEILSSPMIGLGAQLARYCIENDISVRQVADYIGLSRMTVYSWFRGDTLVPRKHEDKVQEILSGQAL